MPDIIYGRHAVLAALRRDDTLLEEVIVAQGARGAWLAEVRRRAREGGVRLRDRERTFLDRVCGTPHHQGVAARRGEYVYRSLDNLLDLLPQLPYPALLLALDGITDPMNLGNICRSALAAGANGVILPKDRAVGITSTVFKAAAGALEYLAIFRVTNLADALSRLKEAGLTIIGAAAQAPLPLYRADLTLPLVLVIGGEEKGLRPRVASQCDLMVAIPMATAEIGSLNAASAGAVALFEIHRQRVVQGEDARVDTG